MKSIHEFRIGLVVFWMSIALGGCGTVGSIENATAFGSALTTDVAARADRASEQAVYKPVSYANAAKPGPAIIIIPGEVKSNNATFTQRFGPNNIADFAELELSKANFQVLERSSLGNVMREIELAYNMGDPATAQTLFNKGQLRNTRWLFKFDVVRAENVVEAGAGFSGAALGNIGGTMLGGRSGELVREGAGSLQTAEDAGVWIVGMRYKIIDARTTQQVAQGYAEDKMKLGSAGLSVLGVSSQQAKGSTLDSLVVKLVQANVAEIDKNYK